MNKLKKYGLSTLGLVICSAISQQTVNAFQIDTTNGTGSGGNFVPEYKTYYANPKYAIQNGNTGTPTYYYNGTHDIGDFSLVGELSQNTGLGNITEVLVYNNSSGSNGQSIGSGTMETLLEGLAQTQTAANQRSIPVYATTALVLGLGVNQTGNQPNFNISTLQMSFQIPGSGCASGTINGVTAETCTFTLGESVEVIASGGNDSSEGRFQVDFGYDLFQKFNYLNADNTRNSSHTAGSYNYYLSSLANDTGGNDRFFLSSGLTLEAEKIPFEFSPSLGIILSLGLFGFPVLKKKMRDSFNQQ
jgi:hypothetical protein